MRPATEPLQQFDLVKWRQPMADETAEERYLLMDDPDTLRRPTDPPDYVPVVQIKAVCDLPFPPIMSVELDQIVFANDPLPDAMKVAAVFCQVVARVLTPKQYEKVKTGKKEPGDFADGNMLLDEAFRRFGYDPLSTGVEDTEWPCMSEETLAVWDRAYNMAHGAGYQIDKL